MLLKIYILCFYPDPNVVQLAYITYIFYLFFYFYFNLY